MISSSVKFEHLSSFFNANFSHFCHSLARRDLACDRKFLTNLGVISCFSLSYSSKSWGFILFSGRVFRMFKGCSPFFIYFSDKDTSPATPRIRAIDPSSISLLHKNMQDSKSTAFTNS